MVSSGSCPDDSSSLVVKYQRVMLECLTDVAEPDSFLYL